MLGMSSMYTEYVYAGIICPKCLDYFWCLTGNEELLWSNGVWLMPCSAGCLRRAQSGSISRTPDIANKPINGSNTLSLNKEEWSSQFAAWKILTTLTCRSGAVVGLAMSQADNHGFKLARNPIRSVLGKCDFLSLWGLLFGWLVLLRAPKINASAITTSADPGRILT